LYTSIDACSTFLNIAGCIIESELRTLSYGLNIHPINPRVSALDKFIWSLAQNSSFFLGGVVPITDSNNPHKAPPSRWPANTYCTAGNISPLVTAGLTIYLLTLYVPAYAIL